MSCKSHDPQNLIEIAARAHRVDKDQLDLLVRTDDENVRTVALSFGVRFRAVARVSREHAVSFDTVRSGPRSLGSLVAPCVSSMSTDHFLWLSTGSTLNPIILTFLDQFRLSFAIVPGSVVQTGVKSFGCEKAPGSQSIHESGSDPQWSLEIGAVLLICNVILISLGVSLSMIANDNVYVGVLRQWTPIQFTVGASYSRGEQLQ